MRTTVFDLAKRKAEGRRFAMLTAYDFPSARIAEAAGVPVVLVGDSMGNVVHGAANTLGVTVDDIYWMGNPKEGFVVSIRWSAIGTHRGFGAYGEPTGKQVTLWGITQWVIEDGVVQKEWMMFNEFGILMQLHR